MKCCFLLTIADWCCYTILFGNWEPRIKLSLSGLLGIVSIYSYSKHTKRSQAGRQEERLTENKADNSRFNKYALVDKHIDGVFYLLALFRSQSPVFGKYKRRFPFILYIFSCCCQFQVQNGMVNLNLKCYCF